MGNKRNSERIAWIKVKKEEIGAIVEAEKSIKWSINKIKIEHF